MNLHNIFKSFSKKRDGQEDDVFFESERYFKLCTCRIKNHNLVLLNEVDAVEESDDGILDDIRLIFKPDKMTKRHVNSFYRDKYLVLWARALLVNQRKIIFAHKNTEHTVTQLSVQDTDTDAMVNAMRSDLDTPDEDEQRSTVECLSSIPWDPQICLEFLNRFLSFVRDRAMNDPRASDGKIVSFYFKPDSIRRGVLVKGFEKIIPKFQEYDYHKIPGWDTSALDE